MYEMCYINNVLLLLLLKDGGERKWEESEKEGDGQKGKKRIKQERRQSDMFISASIFKDQSIRS